MTVEEIKSLERINKMAREGREKIQAMNLTGEQCRELYRRGLELIRQAGNGHAIKPCKFAYLRPEAE
ncbi:MAG: hypothetical protein LBK60_08010 [Verrucomicrobiales bacterium]|nr:hypothetical protein [Verrucomicrobiales bacterium]